MTLISFRPEQIHFTQDMVMELPQTSRHHTARVSLHHLIQETQARTCDNRLITVLVKEYPRMRPSSTGSTVLMGIRTLAVPISIAIPFSLHSLRLNRKPVLLPPIHR